jgi:hypothetical protein
MNRRDAALWDALSRLARPNRRRPGGYTSNLRPTDIGDLVLTELHMRRRRLARLLRLLKVEMRRNGGAALPSGIRAKTTGRSGRSRHAA